MGLWVFTSDLHGHRPFYEALAALCAERQPSVVVLGGDLGPHASGPEGAAFQREFFSGAFADFAARLAASVAGLSLLVLMGNDDWRANHDVLEELSPALWRVLHGRAYELGAAEAGVALAGLSWVPITPFALKDWELWDTPDAPPGERLAGYRSHAGGLSPFAFDAARRSPTIADELEKLARHSDPSRTVYVLHSPPYGTACDQIGGHRHVGSRAIRAFLERHRPPLSLSGHIHESPRISGAFADRVGATLIVNPGQFDGNRQWCAVTFDIADVAGTLEHTVRGRA